MPKAICDQCGKEFDCQSFRIREYEQGKRKHLYCSTKCTGEAIRAKPNAICPVCGKEFHISDSERKKTKHENCCSYECANKLRSVYYSGEGNHQYGLKGDKNSSWKSDERISSYGYKLIRKLDHPFRNSSDFVFEHRLVAEEFLLTDENSVEIDGKKYLSPDYDVHHKDGNRLNNSPENLLVLTPKEHAEFHRTNRRPRLNAEQVFEIKKLSSDGISSRKIAEMFGVSYMCVNSIIKGNSYKNVI